VHLLGAVVVMIIGFTMVDATAIQYVMMMAGVMVLQVIYSVYQANKEYRDTSPVAHE